jgi:hypothetical protein
VSAWRGELKLSLRISEMPGEIRIVDLAKMKRQQSCVQYFMLNTGYRISDEHLTERDHVKI